MGSMAPAGSTLRSPAALSVLSGTPNVRSTWPWTGSRLPQKASWMPAEALSQAPKHPNESLATYVLHSTCQSYGQHAHHFNNDCTFALIALGGRQQQVCPLHSGGPVLRQVNKNGRGLSAQAAALH